MKSGFLVSNLYSDHMVFQQGRPIRVVGDAPAFATVFGQFGEETATATADTNGRWVLEFSPRPAGGPYTLKISNPHAAYRVFHDILVGEVWFCSGQSNMEFPVWGEGQFFRLKDGAQLASRAHDDAIRILNVGRALGPDGPCDELPILDTWRPATSFKPVAECSAVAYHFALELRRLLPAGTPVGLISSSWGGTMIEPWISKEAFEAAGRDGELDRIATRVLEANDPEKAQAEIARKKAEVRAKTMRWFEAFYSSAPAVTAEALASWAKPGIDLSEWKSGALASFSGLNREGVVWYRTDVTLPAGWEGKPVTLQTGAINDVDETFFDGEKVGETTVDVDSYWAIPRAYTFTCPSAPAGGAHTLAFRVSDHFSSGYISTDITLRGPDGMTLQLGENGTWFERREFAADIGEIGVRPPVAAASGAERESQQSPATLYNSMTFGATAMDIAGVLWYQGCSNAGAYRDYVALQRILIEDWRRAWRNPELPFLITQLSAFQQHQPENRLEEDFWKRFGPRDNPGYAPMREVQESFLDYPGAGVACTIDAGDQFDIHPADKKTVGVRLAHEALRVAYGRADALPGPRLASAERVGNRIRVTFENVGDGLFLKEPAGPHLFAVSDAKGDCRWGTAELDADGKTLWIFSDEVAEPVAAEYAFSAFPPRPSLYRKGDLLPVFPFRTEKPAYLISK